MKKFKIKIPNKIYKKENYMNNNNLNGNQLKKSDIDEEEGLIKNKKKNRKYKQKINNISNTNSSFVIKAIKISIILMIFFIINMLLLFKNYLITPYEVLNLNKKSLQWYQKLQNFYNLCSKGINIYKKRFKKNANPKFSLIIPVLNKVTYLNRLITSIQNQLFDNIEIIFVDDCSKDGSKELIEQYMRKDKRIALIKHEINKGTFITRNDGVLNANGEYIIFIDPDDMILENSLQNLYQATLNYTDIDVIQFRAYKKRSGFTPWARGYKEFNKIVEQPELCSIMFYTNGKLDQVNYFIWGKLIKRKILLETIEKLGDYRNKHMTLYEDVALLFVLLQIAKNYVFVNIYGYIYCVSSISVFENRFKYKRANKTIKDCFLLGEILFDFSKNTTYDKLMALHVMYRIDWHYYYLCGYVTEGFEYIFKVLNKYIKCEYLKPRNKFIIYKLKKLFEDVQNKLK